MRLTTREFEAAAGAERDDEASGVFAPLAGVYERLTVASHVSTAEAKEAVVAAIELLG